MPPSCNEFQHSTPKNKTLYLSPSLDSTFKNNINTTDDSSILLQELVTSSVVDDEDFEAELPDLLIAQPDIELNLVDKHISEAELYKVLNESRNAFNSIKSMLKKNCRRKGNSRKKIKISRDNKVNYLFFK